MAFGFWDALIFSTSMAVRDYYRDKQKQKEKQRNFYQKCNEEIADAAADMFEVITAVATKAYTSDYIPNDIAGGSLTLSFYAFLKVLQAQVFPPTAEQNKLLELFFKTLNVNFSKYDFLVAVKSHNQTSQYLEALVGISNSKVGTFWRLFFKAMYKTNSDIKILSEIIELFSSIVMRFAILGKSDSEVALPICEEFIDAIHHQFEECQSLPEEGFDYMCEVSFIDYHQRMKEIYQILAYESGDSEELDINQCFEFFSIGIIYEVIKQSTLSIYDKAEMLNYILSFLEINLGIDGYEIIQLMQTDSDLKEMISIMCDLNPGERGGFWEIILIMGDKANKHDLSTTFFKECFNFLLGVEIELVKKYPDSGFNQSARSYMSNVMGKIHDLFE